MSEDSINPEDYSRITLTIGATDKDGLEHATQSIFPVSVQLFDEDINAQSYAVDLAALIEPLIKDCVDRITKIADLTDEQRDNYIHSEERERVEAGNNYYKESWHSNFTKH